jgi:hypothetical protein
MTIDKINADKEEKDTTKTVCVFTMKGNHNYIDADGFPRLEENQEESPDAYAKKVCVGNRCKHFVKRGSHGRLYNPIGLYSEGTSRKQSPHTGRPEWNFRETTEGVFSKYINFLKTKNPAWLNNAERE